MAAVRRRVAELHQHAEDRAEALSLRREQLLWEREQQDVAELGLQFRAGRQSSAMAAERADGGVAVVDRLEQWEVAKRCVVRGSNSGHQLLLPPASWCPIFAVWTTQGAAGGQCPAGSGG